MELIHVLAADPTVVVGGSATAVLLGAAMTLIVRMVREANTRIKGQGQAITQLQVEQRRCDHRLAIAIEAMQRAGIAVPEEVFG